MRARAADFTDYLGGAAGPEVRASARNALQDLFEGLLAACGEPGVPVPAPER